MTTHQFLLNSRKDSSDYYSLNPQTVSIIDSNNPKSYVSDLTEYTPQEKTKMLSSQDDLERTAVFKRKVNNIFSFPKMGSKNYTEISSSAKGQNTSQESESVIRHRSNHL